MVWSVKVSPTTCIILVSSRDWVLRSGKCFRWSLSTCSSLVGDSFCLASSMIFYMQIFPSLTPRSISFPVGLDRVIFACVNLQARHEEDRGRARNLFRAIVCSTFKAVVADRKAIVVARSRRLEYISTPYLFSFLPLPNPSFHIKHLRTREFTTTMSQPPKLPRPHRHLFSMPHETIFSRPHVIEPPSSLP